MAEVLIDHFAALGVSRDASISEIKQAREQLVKRFHEGGTDPDEERLKDVHAAWHVLQDEEARRRLSAQLADKEASEEREKRQREKEREREERAEEVDPRSASGFGDALRGKPPEGERKRPEPKEPNQVPPGVRPPSASSNEPTAGDSQGRKPDERPRRLLNMVLALCAVVGGYLLIKVAQANQRHDEIAPGRSAGHYGSEAVVGIFALLLFLGGCIWFLRELVQLFTGEKPPFGS